MRHRHRFVVAAVREDGTAILRCECGEEYEQPPLPLDPSSGVKNEDPESRI